MKRRKRRAPAAKLPEARPDSAPGTVGRDGRRHWLPAVLVLGLATLLAYANSFSAGFALDNKTLLLEDPRIQSASAANFDLILRHTYWWPNGESGLYRPLTTLSYLLNYTILGNGNHPAGYHWINLLLHMANVLLVFALVLRMLKGRERALRIAFAIAMLWAVHPVLTESVTNIVGRADLLACAAELSAFLLYLKSTETSGWRRGVLLCGLAASTAAGVFSKESAVVIVPVIVLYEMACGRQWRRMWAGCLATLVPVGTMLWQRAIVLNSALPAEYPFTDNPIAGAGFWIGRLTALKVLARYLWLAFWPVKLSADYSYSEVPLANGSPGDWIGWLAVAGALVLAAILWKRDRVAFFFAGFAFLNLLPASNLLFPIGTTMAERLLYLPLVGVVAAVILPIDKAGSSPGRRFRISGAVFALCVGAIAGGFAIRTWIRNFDWADDKTMAVAGVQAAPRSFKFHRLLAAELIAGEASHREAARAAAEADRSVAILAGLPDELDTAGPWNLAAVCHRVKGDTLAGGDARVEYDEAAKLALRSIAIDAASRAAYARQHGITSPVPSSAAEGYRTLASIYLRLGRPPQALEAAQQAQSIDPANSGAYEEMAGAYLAQERGEDAAVALAQGMLATGDRKLFAGLLKLYRSGLDSKGCAAAAGLHGPVLNPHCEIVLRDLCEAAARLRRADLRRRLACPG